MGLRQTSLISIRRYIKQLITSQQLSVSHSFGLGAASGPSLGASPDSIASHGDERRDLSTGIIATTRVSSPSYYRRRWSVANNNNTKSSETHILKTDIWSKDNSPPQAVVFQKLQYNKVELLKNSHTLTQTPHLLLGEIELYNQQNVFLYKINI